MNTTILDLNRLLDSKIDNYFTDESLYKYTDFQKDINAALEYYEEVDCPSEMLSFFNNI